VPGIYDTTELKKHATADDPWALKWLQNHTAGFGAYHLESVSPGEQAVYVANPNYFRPAPYFDRVIYRAVPSGASRVSLLKAGQVNWVENMTIQQVKDLQKDSRVKVVTTVGRGVSSFRMNPKFKPFDDVRVRQAVNYAIDKKVINSTVFLDAGTPAGTLVPPFIEGAILDANPYAYNPDKAKELLAAAGLPNGFETEILYSSLFTWEEPMAIQLAAQLKAVGIRATPKRITNSDMKSRSNIKKMDMPFFSYEDSPIVLDPVYTMYLMARSTGVSNRSAFNNPKIDELIDSARKELDKSKRLAMMTEAQHLWVEGAPWILTVFRPVFEAMTTDITGWYNYPDDHERWYNLGSSK
jgi:ABC-type transport system substrate-binding protein